LTDRCRALFRRERQGPEIQSFPHDALKRNALDAAQAGYYIDQRGLSVDLPPAASSGASHQGIRGVSSAWRHTVRGVGVGGSILHPTIGYQLAGDFLRDSLPGRRAIHYCSVLLRPDCRTVFTTDLRITNRTAAYPGRSEPSGLLIIADAGTTKQTPEVLDRYSSI
jgi:hypothetical protein